MAGAVDLSVLKERADAQRAQASRPNDVPSGPQRADDAHPAAGYVVEVTEANFEAEVLTRSTQQLVVVVLWSPRSAATAKMVQLLASSAQQSGGRWALAAVDADANPRIVQAFQAQGVPLIIAIAQGRPVAEFEGRSEGEIAPWIDSILAQIGHTFAGAPPEPADEPEEADPRMVAAEDKFNSGDLDGALAAYREIAAAEPNNAEVASLIRNIEFMARANAHDDSVLESAPDDVDGQLAAADKLLLEQRPEDAFDRIITAIKLSDGDDRTKARTRLLELFELFDPAEAFVVAARRKLAAALY
ncbi:putative thioredoxin [Gordonia effusa NBRC 100432]|uniref:Putative thioredoxin n=1 Tax=Gordonia effusa NBRC 100432 TaxID=1077974 RepID=H0R6G3_9ACTN|nr:tetratricopeptide repeat protein [Gordonia effusa]GAB20664.1 putative thioredoxin [Gordonia effusa NBRC 100432]